MTNEPVQADSLYTINPGSSLHNAGVPVTLELRRRPPNRVPLSGLAEAMNGTALTDSEG